MGCEPVRFPDGGFGIVCSRGGRKRAPCGVCGQRPHTKLCDGPPPPGARRKTCDQKLCDACAFVVGPVLPTVPAEVRGYFKDATTQAWAARQLEKRYPRELDTRDLCPACRNQLCPCKPAPAESALPPTASPTAPAVALPKEELVSETTRIRICIVEGELPTDSAVNFIKELMGKGIVIAETALPPGVTGQVATAKVPAAPPPAPLAEEAKAAPAPARAPRKKPEEAAPAPAPAPAVAPPPPPAPAPVPAPAAPAPTGARVLSEAEVMEVAGAKKLADVLRYMRERGIATAEALAAECLRLRSAIGILGRIREDQLTERVTYTLEGMV